MKTLSRIHVRSIAGALSAIFTSACGPAALPVVSATSKKPPSPLSAPADMALVVVVKNNTARGGGWSDYSVIDDHGAVVAQFPDDFPPGWTTLRLEPGKHTFFVRTYTSSQCQKVEGDFAPGKIYVLGLSFDPLTYDTLVERMESTLGAVRNVRWLTPAKDDAAGPLAFHRYAVVDATAAARLTNSSEVTACVAAAERDAQHRPAPVAGAGNAYDSIQFTSAR